VSVRSRSAGDLGARPVSEFVTAALEEIARKGTGLSPSAARSGEAPSLVS